MGLQQEGVERIRIRSTPCVPDEVSAPPVPQSGDLEAVLAGGMSQAPYLSWAVRVGTGCIQGLD